MEEKKDKCTGFPESWVQWYLYKGWIPAWRVVDISECCGIHDEECSTIAFTKCLWEKNIAGTIPIVAVAASVCVIKYGKV